MSEQPKPPKEPVGGNFKQLASSLGIAPSCCDCKKLMKQMDRLGAKGCREHRERLIERLRANAKTVPWLQKLLAVAPAIWNGLSFKVNPLDPIPGLFDEAVRRTETQG